MFIMKLGLQMEIICPPGWVLNITELVDVTQNLTSTLQKAYSMITGWVGGEGAPCQAYDTCLTTQKSSFDSRQQQNCVRCVKQPDQISNQRAFLFSGPQDPFSVGKAHTALTIKFVTHLHPPPPPTNLQHVQKNTQKKKTLRNLDMLDTEETV